MEKNKLYTSQIGKIIFILLISSNIVYIPAKIFRQDAWLGILLSSLMGFYILYVFIKTQLLFPEKPIAIVASDLLGKIPGHILNGFFLFIIFSILIGYGIDVSIVLTTINPRYSPVLLNSVIYASCGFVVYHGINSVARLSNVIVWFVIIFLIFGFLLPLTQADFSQLTPLLAEWRPLIFQSIFVSSWPFSEIVIIGAFLFLSSDLKQNKRVVYYWYSAAVLSLIAFTILSLVILGPELTLLYNFPTQEVLHLNDLGAFSRLDIFFTSFWVSASFVAIICYYQSFTMFIQQLFSLKSNRGLIIPAGLMAFASGLSVDISNLAYFDWFLHYLPLVNFFIIFTYVSALLTAVQLYSAGKLKTRPGSDSA
ncbi:MAG: spore germination protein [Syntrophomonadaceae bacterium]|nr:spore germination protein [Syntrophomonadaceae bacterium]